MNEQENQKEQSTHAENVNVREIVWQILNEHELHGTYSNILIKRAQDRYASLPLTQRSFLKRLAEGTIERELELDSVIQNHQKDPDLKIKPRVRCLLRMSLYQIFYMDSVPDYAACSEAVRLCKRKKLAQAAGFVNGILRAVCREKEAASKEGREFIPTAAPAKKEVRSLSLQVQAKSLRPCRLPAIRKKAANSVNWKLVIPCRLRFFLYGRSSLGGSVWIPCAGRCWRFVPFASDWIQGFQRQRRMRCWKVFERPGPE